MRKLAALALCVLVAGCQRPEVDVSDLAELNGVYLQRSTGQPYSGRVLGQVRGLMKNGHWQGRVTTYFDEGKPQSEAHFRDGVMHGLTRSWYVSGHLRSESRFVDGKLDGSLRQWFDNGQLQSEKNYLNGNEQGIERGYLPDGSLSFERGWDSGRRHGFEIYFCLDSSASPAPGTDPGLCLAAASRTPRPVVVALDTNGSRYIWCFERGGAVDTEQCLQWVEVHKGP